MFECLPHSEWSIRPWLAVCFCESLLGWSRWCSRSVFSPWLNDVSGWGHLALCALFIVCEIKMFIGPKWMLYQAKVWGWGMTGRMVQGGTGRVWRLLCSGLLSVTSSLCAHRVWSACLLHAVTMPPYTDSLPPEPHSRQGVPISETTTQVLCG